MLLEYVTTVAIISSALIYSNILEWFIHKHILHGLGKNKNSFWSFHWHNHHKNARKSDNYDEDYKKGYDRLTNGISSKWEATYRYYDKGGRFQMYAGLNMTLAYTSIQREYLFDKMEYTPNTKSWDKLAGVKVGIIIPIHRKNEEKFHYY